jgi:hypothetical protein
VFRGNFAVADPAEIGPEVTVRICTPALFSTMKVTDPSFTGGGSRPAAVTVAVSV